MHKGKSRRSLLNAPEDLDPMAGMGNLFDVAMVFSVALMVALVSYLDIADLLFAENFTMVKNPGGENMEIVTKKDGKILHYQAQPSQDKTAALGKRVGVAYRMPSGEIVYLPD